MPQHLQILNFPLDPSSIIARLDFSLADEFQRDLVSSYTMFGNCQFSHDTTRDSVDLRLTLPNEPVPRVRPTIYCPIRAGALDEFDDCCERDLPGAAGAGRVVMLGGGGVEDEGGKGVCCRGIESICLCLSKKST